MRISPPPPGVVAGDFYPVWSPDGRRIAFSRFHGPDTGVDVFVMDSRGGSPVRITQAPGNDVVTDWR